MIVNSIKNLYMTMTNSHSLKIIINENMLFNIKINDIDTFEVFLQNILFGKYENIWSNNLNIELETSKDTFILKFFTIIKNQNVKNENLIVDYNIILYYENNNILRNSVRELLNNQVFKKICYEQNLICQHLLFLSSFLILSILVLTRHLF